MQPSSLIFLVIVAIWAAYLIQHWVRRREHLATARSVDRFSEAMRVLERRSPLPATMLAAAKPATPSPVTRPEVVVKRASVSSPLRARHGAAGSAAGGSGGSAAPVHPVAPIELVPHRTTLQVVLRRVRGVLFLAALVAVPVTLLLSAMHILKWLSLALAASALVAVVVWLRVAAIQEQKARRARRAELRRLERMRAGDVSVRRPQSAEKASVRSPAPAPVMAPLLAPVAARAEARETPADAPVEAPAAPDVAPGSWQPVPVPPPTYTLKEPAHRPEPVSRPEPMRPVPIEVEDDEIEVMAALHGRRVVGH